MIKKTKLTVLGTGLMFRICGIPSIFYMSSNVVAFKVILVFPTIFELLAKTLHGSVLPNAERNHTV